MNRACFTALPTLLLLGACTLGPNFTPPQTHTAAYAAPGDLPLPADQHLVLGGAATGNWWQQFRSPKLDAVIALALANNQNVAAARSRVAVAREDVTAAEGALLPEVSLDATAGRQKYGKALFGPLDIAIPPFTYYEAGPAVSVPLDIFGAGRRGVEEAKAYQEYQGFEVDAAKLSLAGNVTLQALAIAAAQAQIDVVQGIIAEDQRNVNLVQTSLGAGTGTRTQLLTAQSQLATDRTLLPDLQQQENVARHALAILVGEAPADWRAPDFTLDDFTLPDEIMGAVPSELAHQRPDIRAAEAQLHAASAAIGVATANLYPKIDLTGALTQEALVPGGLFNAASAAWSVAAGITQPLYDGGQLSAKRRAALDDYQTALALYRQTVIASFGQVADQLQALSYDAAQLQDQTAAAQVSVAARNLARTSFSDGDSGILDVVDADRRAAEAQIGVAKARAQRLADTAKLDVALGGTVAK